MSRAIDISWGVVSIVAAFCVACSLLLLLLWGILEVCVQSEKLRDRLENTQEKVNCKKCPYKTDALEYYNFGRLIGESLAKEKTDEAPEDPVEKPKYWYVYAENSEEIYGIPKGRDIHIGAYKTKAEAERLQYILAKEGKWENMFVFPADWLLASETVRIEVGELEERFATKKRCDEGKKEKVDADLDFQVGRIIGKMEAEIACAVDNQTAYENAEAEFEFAREDFRSAREKLRIAAKKAGVPFPPALDEEKPFWEKKEYEDVRIELSEDEQEQDKPSPESEVSE